MRVLLGILNSNLNACERVLLENSTCFCDHRMYYSRRAIAGADGREIEHFEFEVLTVHHLTLARESRRKSGEVWLISRTAVKGESGTETKVLKSSKASKASRRECP